MKQYVVDELRPADYQKLKQHLNANAAGIDIEGIYWIPLDDQILTDVQAAHQECRPFYFAIALEPNRLAGEFLIRRKNRIHCSCTGYADLSQKEWIMRFVDNLFERLKIKT